MKKNLLIISLIFILPIFAYYILSNSNTTSAEKISTNKPTTPVVIKFTSSMCIDCKKLTEVTNDIYPKYKNEVAMENIAVENNNKDVIQKIKKYNVVLVPTLIFLNSDGKQVKKVEGYINKETFDKYMKELINGTLS